MPDEGFQLEIQDLLRSEANKSFSASDRFWNLILPNQIFKVDSFLVFAVFPWFPTSAALSRTILVCDQLINVAQHNRDEEQWVHSALLSASTSSPLHTNAALWPPKLNNERQSYIFDMMNWQLCE